MLQEKQKITTKMLKGLGAGDGKTIIWDTEITGFGVRLGKKVPVFILGFRTPGKAYSRVSIGRADQIPVDKARDKAKTMIGEAARGNDPQAEKRARIKAAKAAAATERKQGRALSTVVDEYLAWLEELDRSDAHIRAARLYTEGKMIPVWGNRPISSITKDDARELLASVPEKTGSVKHSIYRYGRALWDWAIKADYVEQNLWAAMHAPPRPKPRNNWLKNEAEIKSFWLATGEIEEPWRSMCRILLLTGARRSEIAEMQWNELDRDKKLLTIKASERGTKTKHDYFMPLVDEVIAMLDHFAPDNSETWPIEGYVFTTTGTSAVSGFSKAVTRLRGMLKKHCYTKHFRLHDLRRTHFNWLLQLGVRPDIALYAENKTSTFKNLAPSYLWYAYEKEIREVQDKWRDHVMECVK